MLERRVIDARPPRVEYRLTDEGRRLKLVVDAVAAFATAENLCFKKSSSRAALIWLVGVRGCSGRERACVSETAPSAAALLARTRRWSSSTRAERFGADERRGLLADADLAGGRYDVRACSARDGLAALQCYDDADEPAAPVVYGAVFRAQREDRAPVLALPRVRPLEPARAAEPRLLEAHEGDWEAVTVLLDPAGRPGRGRREPPLRRRAAGLGEGGEAGARPVVYSALGSHALYFGPGRYRQEARCWPQRRGAVFEAYKVPIVDHARRAGRTLSPRVVPVSRTSPAWMRFPGRFGETQYLHFPQATFASAPARAARRFHDLWRKPFAVPRAWPRG